MEFLKDYLSKEYQKNIFTEGYGTERAYADGYARLAYKLLDILEKGQN